MKIILDTNILISAIIKDSFIRKLLFENSTIIHIPDYVLDEIKEHEIEIAKKSKLGIDEMRFLIKKLIKNTEIVRRENILPFREKAREIIQNIDIDDVLIIASALYVNNSIIWSEDKDLKRQIIIKVCNTKEIVNLLSRNDS